MDSRALGLGVGHERDCSVKWPLMNTGGVALIFASSRAWHSWNFGREDTKALRHEEGGEVTVPTNRGRDDFVS
jgi:hypothetical protein